jgi:hypothetical protein
MYYLLCIYEYTIKIQRRHPHRFTFNDEIQIQAFLIYDLKKHNMSMDKN